jgi:integrase
MSKITDMFELHMRTAKMSPDTIKKRLEILRRLAAVLENDDDYSPKPLIEATPDDLAAFQGTFAHLAPASMDIYSRHVRAFYRWAVAYGHVAADPCGRMVVPRKPRGLPHPTSPDDLRVIFACTRRPLRTAYALAAFAGLRAGEITRLRWEDVDLRQRTAYVRGKGQRDRIVPLLPPVVDELQRVGLAPRGPVVVLPSGRPFTPNRLSMESCRHLTQLPGVSTTLHGLRHSFGTLAYRYTRDPLLVRDLLGHESVATTEIYMQTSMDGAGERLASLAGDAAGLLDDGGHPQWLTS